MNKLQNTLYKEGRSCFLPTDVDKAIMLDFEAQDYLLICLASVAQTQLNLHAFCKASSGPQLGIMR